MAEDYQPRDLIYTPQEVATYSLAEVQRRHKDKATGIPLGLANVDRRLKPLRPGELVTIIARPSHYKSGLAQWWARWIAQDVAKRGSSEVVVYGSCEMAIEELGIYDLSVSAALDADRVASGGLTEEELLSLRGASMNRAALPLWLLGHSLERRKKRIRMTVYRIEQALYWIEDHMEFKSRIVFLDYLNLMQSERVGGHQPERRIAISEIVQCAKDLALSMACPVVLIAQAHRRVEDRPWRLPTMRDCMETAAIEQYSDKILSLWFPCKDYAVGAQIATPDSSALKVTESLLLLGIIKQKTGPAGGYCPLHVEPERNYLAPMMDERDPFYGEQVPI